MYPGLRPIVSSLVKPLGPRACAWSACVAMLAHTALPVAQPIAKASLPEPSGAFGVGRTSYNWVDIARQNPFASDSSARRELMVYLWYPTEPGQRTSASEYLPGARAIDVAPGSGRLRQSPLWPLIVAGSIASHAQARAPLARRPERFPVVVFSHGDGVSTFEYTAAIEDLASHGYVVAAVEHPFSSAAVVFPSGAVIQFADRRMFRGDRPPDTPYFEGVQIAMSDLRRLTEIHAADLRFVLGQLEQVERQDKNNVATTFNGRLDLRHVATVGHSSGGFAAFRACQLDARISACVNLDGGTADGALLQLPWRFITEPAVLVRASHSAVDVHRPAAHRARYHEKGVDRLCTGGCDRTREATPGWPRGELQSGTALARHGAHELRRYGSGRAGRRRPRTRTKKLAGHDGCDASVLESASQGRAGDCDGRGSGDRGDRAKVRAVSGSRSGEPV